MRLVNIEVYFFNSRFWSKLCFWSSLCFYKKLCFWSKLCFLSKSWYLFLKIVYGEADYGLGRESKKNLEQIPTSAQPQQLDKARHPAYLDQPDKWHQLIYNFMKALAWTVKINLNQTCFFILIVLVNRSNNGTIYQLMTDRKYTI